MKLEIAKLTIQPSFPLVFEVILHLARFQFFLLHQTQGQKTVMQLALMNTCFKKLELKSRLNLPDIIKT